MNTSIGEPFELFSRIVYMAKVHTNKFELTPEMVSSGLGALDSFDEDWDSPAVRLQVCFDAILGAVFSSPAKREELLRILESP